MLIEWTDGMMPSPDTVLEIADNLQIVRMRSGHTEVLRDGIRVSCGSHGLALLSAFEAPRTLAAAAALLASQTASQRGVMSLLNDVGRLCAAGVLLEAGTSNPNRFVATAFSAAAIHVTMLNDRARTEAFIEAIRRTVRPGDVVVDLGTGTGVLALTAALAGASRVYAVEASDIAMAAAGMFEANGVQDRVTLLRGWSTDLALPERADVFVSETLGHSPWAEGYARTAADAHDRFLKPNARIIPACIRLFAQPTCIPESAWSAMSFSDANARRWSEWYGFDFTSLTIRERAHVSSRLVPGTYVAAWPRPSPSVLLAEVHNERTEAIAPTDVTGRTAMTSASRVDGAWLHWEADLAHGISLATDPARNPTSHWNVQLVPARAAVDAPRGATLCIHAAVGHRSQLTLSVE